MPAEVLVRGEAEVRCLPDRAMLNVVVDGEGNSQQDAFRRASDAARSVDAVFEKFADSLDRRITSGVVVRPKTRWKKGESITSGWIATRTTSLDVKDFTTLGEMISQLPSAGATSLSGPFWRVDPSNEAHTEARQAAALDARRRAESYAGALGLRLGNACWIAEPGLRIEGGSPAGRFAAAPIGMARSAAAPDEPMDIRPDEITIEATVEACWELESQS